MNAVEISNTTKTFGSLAAVDGLSLSVPAGCVYGFIGPNGSGKTTTLRMIMNIFLPDSGTIRVLGQERHQAWADRIGYLPEERGLYAKMKVRDVLRFYAKLKNGADVNRSVDRWLERLDLADWAGKRVEALSKGMSQKVQFIAAVVHRPELVILDEPFTGLDPVNTDVLQQAVLELQANGATVIFSTHDMNTAEAMCDFICMIFKGRKVLDGTLSQIQDQYGTDTVRVRIDGDHAALRDLPGVQRITDRGQLQELRLADGADSQQVLAAIMSRARVRHFELARPSLHEIFVRIASPGAEEAADA
jgi:ABC-2 type transport system ATP-binding protein